MEKGFNEYIAMSLVVLTLTCQPVMAMLLSSMSTRIVGTWEKKNRWSCCSSCEFATSELIWKKYFPFCTSTRFFKHVHTFFAKLTEFFFLFQSCFHKVFLIWYFKIVITKLKKILLVSLSLSCCRLSHFCPWKSSGSCWECCIKFYCNIFQIQP